MKLRPRAESLPISGAEAGKLGRAEAATSSKPRGSSKLTFEDVPSLSASSGKAASALAAAVVARTVAAVDGPAVAAWLTSSLEAAGTIGIANGPTFAADCDDCGDCDNCGSCGSCGNRSNGDVRAGVAVGIRAFAFPVSDATLGTQDSAWVNGGASCSRAEKPTLWDGKPNEDKRRLNRRSVKLCDRLSDENSPVVAKRLSKPRSNRSTDERSGEENAIKGWALELVGMAATASTQSDRRRTYSHRLSANDSPCFAPSATLYLVTL